MKNDSPNGLVIDALCMGVGAIAGFIFNFLIYQNRIAKAFDYANGIMLLALLVAVGALALQKIKRTPFGKNLYALTIGLVGWGVGTFIIVELYRR